MEHFLAFFETIPSSYRSIILASGILVFWILEGVVPLKQLLYGRWRHLGINLVFTATTLLINLSLAFLIVLTADFVTQHEIGVWNWLSAPLWIQVIVGLLLLDFIGAWFVHWVEHKVKWMWKFHLIHHTDTTVDVSTALRHHPGESIFRALFTILAVFVAGAPIAVVFIYQTASALFSQFNHANIKLPRTVDRLLAYVIVTPAMHKVHHHYKQPLTDTNYGNIFSIWDRAFRTYAEVENVSKLTYGIDTHMDAAEHDNVANLMAIPFQAYRPPTGSKFGSEDDPSSASSASADTV